MTALQQDLRFALRGYRRSPGFTAIAILTLALGVGGTTSIFSFVEALLLRRLPIAAPEQLVVLGPGGGGLTGESDMPQDNNFSFAQYEGLRRQNDAFQAVAASGTFNTGTTVRTEQDADPEASLVLSTQLVSADYFDLLGLHPAAGRLLTPSDMTAPGADAVVVLGYDYWMRKRGGSPDVVGSTLSLQDLPYRVLGVTPAGFTGHQPDNPADLWVPLTMQAQITRVGSLFERTPPMQSFWLDILGRVQPGLSRDEAEVRLNVRLQQIFLSPYGTDVSPQRRAEIAKVHVPLTPAGGGLSSMRNQLRGPLTLLWAATGLILLIGCANLANLLLARAADRRREVSVRRALGAGPVRIIRQMLTECLLLAGFGAAAGLALASWLIPILKSVLTGLRGPNHLAVGLDATVLAFSLAASLLTVLLFGLAPAIWAARRDVADGLKAGAKGSTPSRAHAISKSALVATQTALSIVLLAGAGLFLRTLAELRGVDLGVELDNVVLMRTNGRRAGLPREGDDAMRRMILARLDQTPGVVAASFTTTEPLSGNYNSSTMAVEGYEPAPNENTNAINKIVTDGYFQTLGVGLVEGRMLSPADRYDQTCLVSKAFAKRFFPARSAVGGVVRTMGQACIVEGVVEDVREVRIRDALPQVVYRPALGYDNFLPLLIARVDGDPSQASEAMRTAIAETAPQLPVNSGFSLLERTLDRSLTIERLLGRVTATFAGVALLLASTGLFGLMSYVVRQRTAEIGLRQALGASTRDILAMTLRQAATPVAIGIGVGLAGIAALGRTVEQLLYAVTPTDVWALSGAVSFMLAAALAAAFLPARRAARIDPVDALRQE
ncbi:MAG: ABC transporter permease [Bryobacterales bacterium]|nr:ABC transporter permease [Acidobacteriota bacterium]MCB9384045.1 ABC transporter permease [Bryobacterales bacterium]